VIVASLLEKALTAVDSDEVGLVKQILTTSGWLVFLFRKTFSRLYAN
jgi:hypothetical protein